MEEVAIHAAAIRNSFFDDRKNMDNVIPPVLLVTLDNRNEVAPRSLSRVSSSTQPLAAVPKPAPADATRPSPTPDKVDPTSAAPPRTEDET